MCVTKFTTNLNVFVPTGMLFSISASSSPRFFICCQIQIKTKKLLTESVQRNREVWEKRIIQKKAPNNENQTKRNSVNNKWKAHSSFSRAVNQQRRPYLWAAGADGRSEDPLETTWPSSDLTARPCLASAASERHFSPGSPEETPLHKMLFLPAAALCCLCSGECFQPIRSQQSQPLTNTVTLTFIYLSVSLQRWLPWQQSWFRIS